MIILQIIAWWTVLSIIVGAPLWMWFLRHNRAAQREENLWDELYPDASFDEVRT